MTARETRFGLLAVLVLATGLTANMLLFQSPQHVRSRVDADVQAELAAAERARRLSLGTVETSSTPSGPMSPLRRVDGAMAIGSAAAVPAPAADPARSAPPSQRRDAEGVDTIRAIQRELQIRGYQPGTVDGVPGMMTRAAIMAFEHDQGLPLTGEASDRILKTILLGAPGRAADAAAVAPAPDAEAVIRTVQQTLASLGYPVGEVDGRVGRDTQRAIKAFEADARLPESGRVSGALLAALAKATAAQGRSTRR